MTSRRRTKQSSSRDAKAPPSSGHDKLFRRSRPAPIPAIQPCRQRERLLPPYRPSGSLGDNHLNTLWMGQDGSYKYAASSSTFLEGPHLVSTLVAFSLPFSNQHPPTPSRSPSNYCQNAFVRPLPVQGCHLHRGHRCTPPRGVRSL